MPFWGDQALFAVYGRQLNSGAVLYRDVLDLKQPGIFLFYAAGGRVLGFTEVGIHLFELTYWLAFSLLVIALLRPHLTGGWRALLLPVFTVCIYYLHAGLLELTQIEILVGFPLFVTWWLVDQADPASTRALLKFGAAGLLGAAVVLLKHVYVVIPLVFAGYSLVRARSRGTSARRVLSCLGAYAGGLVVPLLAFVGYLGAHGQLERAWWVHVEWAAAARALDPQPLTNLTSGAAAFVAGHAPVVVLAALGAFHLRRERSRERDLALGMLMWLVVGVGTVFVQFWGVWHWLLLTVPLGVLAMLGVETLSRLGAKPRLPLLVAGGALGGFSFVLTALLETRRWLLLPVAVGVASALVLPAARFERRLVRVAALWMFLAALGWSIGLAAVGPYDKLRVLARNEFGLTVAGRERIRASVNPAYAAADRDLARLGTWGGQMYAFGDPVLLLRARQPQAVAIHGWGPEKLDRRAWRELHRDLREALPRYIVVSELSRSIIRGRHPPLMDFIELRYKVAFTGASGTWYLRVEPSAG